MRIVARWISVLLHPVFMPLYTLALAIWLDPHIGYFLAEEARYIVLAMVAVMTVAFPLVSTLLLLRAKCISSLEMHDREERIAPFTMTMLYFGMAYYLLRESPLHPAILSIFAGIILALLVTIAVTVQWKISIHMVGIGGLLGALAGLSVIHALPLLPVIALAVLLAGVLGTARSLVGTHRPAQIYTGVLLGFVSTYACVLLEVAV